MKLKNLKELEKVMDLCRAKGVREICIDGVTFKLDDLPEPKAQPDAKEAPIDSDPGFLGYSDEQLQQWSTSGN